MAKNDQAVAKAKQPTAIERPSYLASDKQPRGFEGMDNRDVTMPRLALAQSMSPAAKRANPKYIEGLQEGQLFNSISREIYGSWVDVTPLFFFKNRIMFKDLNAGGGVMCMAIDGKSCQLNHGGPCLHGNFGPSGERPECSEFFNYPALIHESDMGGVKSEPELIVLSFKSTAMKKAKDWNARMRMMKADMFAQKWRITAVPDRKDQFDFFNVEFNTVDGGFVQEAFYRSALQSYEMVRQGVAEGRMTVDTEGLDEEGTSFPHGANAAAAAEM